ncbi:MAG: hypothetical protein ACLPJH_15755 [Myxococcaceae bacterium]
MAIVFTFSDSHASEMAETLAIEAPNDVASPVLREGTPLPTEYTRMFWVDAQRAFRLRLLVGASQMASAYRTLLELSVPLEHSASSGKVLVKLTLDVKENGKLLVHTEELGAKRPLQEKVLEVPVRPWDGTRQPDPSDGARQRRLRLWRRLPLLVLITYFVYVVVSDVDEVGLGGWIESLSMRWFGVSYDLLNILFLLAVYFLCKVLLVRGLSAASPGLAALLVKIPPPARRRPKVKRQVDVGPGGCLVLAGVWGAFILLSGAALLGALALGFLAYGAREPAPPSALDLETFSGSVPASRVHLHGWFHEQLATRYTSSVSWPHRTGGGRDSLLRTDYSFTPVTPQHWKPGEPVSFLLKDSHQKDLFNQTMLGRSVHWKPGGDPSSAVDLGTGAVALPPAERTISARLLKNDLPSFIEDAYERAGVHLTHPYWVVDTGDDPTLGVLVGIVCLIFIVGMLFVVMRFHGWWLRQRLRAQRGEKALSPTLP